MKTRSKALVLSLCAVLLVAASVLGTVAYLTATDTVTNTFTVGSVAITLDEADVDSDANSEDNVTVENEVRDQANAYKLIPGQTYEKDPTVRVSANSDDCYLFVKVVNGIVNIEGGTTVAEQMADNGWTVVDESNGLYVYTNKTGNPVAVAAGDSKVVFENFTIDSDVDNVTLNSYDGKTITVTAYAVQTTGFETMTAADIWDAAFNG